MSEGRNMLVGILLGIFLTALLMFVLYQQAGLSSVVTTSAEKNEGPEQPPLAPNVSERFASKQEGAAPKLVVEPKQSAPVVKPIAVAGGGGPQVEASVEPTAIDLPKALDLSSEELEELSVDERAEYDKLIDTYREVRAQVKRLDNEREQLKQRMDKMFEQNEVVERELEQIREAMRKQAEKQSAE